jgi:drug/metabolite transporter (DMT)-like permease
MWLILGLLGSLAFAVVGVMDKFIISKSVARPVVYTFYSTIISLIAFIAIPFGAGFPAGIVEFCVYLASGLLFGFGLWAMYISFAKSEVSHVGPLVGAATAFFTVIFGMIFLGEYLHGLKILAVIFLIAGALLISFEKSRRHQGIHMGMLWAVIAGLLLAGSHIFAKYAYDSYGFFRGFVWTRGTMGFLGLFLLLCGCFKVINRAVKKLFKNHNNGKNGNNHNNHEQPAGQKNPLWLILSDKVLGIVGVVLIQYAMAVGTASGVQALGGVQYALLIIIVAMLSRFWPKIYRETYTYEEMAQEIAAVIIIGIGLAFLV